MWCSCGLFLMWWCGEKGVRPGRDRVEGGVIPTGRALVRVRRTLRT